MHTTPWNGLNMLGDHTHEGNVVTSPELTWDVETSDLYHLNEKGEHEIIPSSRVLRRADTHQPLTIVGGRYTPYQNSEMWSLIEEYCKVTGGKLDGAGIMGGGKNFVWASVKHDEYEAVTGDPITKYDMFVNPFMAGMSFSLITTDIRIVCGNMLNSAVNRNSGAVRIRHAAQVSERVRIAIDAAASSTVKRQEQLEYLKHLSTVQMNGAKIDEFIDKVLPIGEKPNSRTTTRRDTLRTLIENGLGSDLKGVQGTAYGVLQAGIEFADHHMNAKDTLFASMYGSVAEFKQKVQYAVNLLNAA